MKNDAEQSESSVLRTRKLVQFVKELSRAESVEILLERTQAELKSFSRVKAPILAFAKSQTELLLYFYQGSQIVEKVVAGVWPQKLKIRLNNVADSQYLANIFGRPFGRLLTIPLQLKRKSSADDLKVSAILFFEHSLRKDEWLHFLSFIEERLQPLSIALDRILLEQDLSEAAVLWESTFDGLQDPVIILDSENKILRANKSYIETFGDGDGVIHSSGILQYNNQLFEVHKYSIGLKVGGLPTNVICHFVDVTLAHRLRQQMIQNEKMAAIGQMAGHIAHELNNPLTGIRSLAQIILNQSSPGTNFYSDLSEVEHAAERCQTIIKNLIEFSKGDIDHKQKKVSLHEILSRTLPLLKTLISRFEIKHEHTQKACMVYVEPQLMQQVIFNIIKNAAQAMGESGTLTIRTDEIFEADKNWVSLSIRDTGAGINPEHQQQIFDFFFTTKTSGQGTGLGLSMSKSIIEKFNGKIRVQSNVGQGTEFTILLPVADENSTL